MAVGVLVALALHHHEPDFTHFALRSRPAARHWAAAACDLAVWLKAESCITELTHRCSCAAHACNFNRLAITRRLFATAFATEARDKQKEEMISDFYFCFYFLELDPVHTALPRRRIGGDSLDVSVASSNTALA